MKFTLDNDPAKTATMIAEAIRKASEREVEIMGPSEHLSINLGRTVEEELDVPSSPLPYPPTDTGWGASTEESSSASTASSPSSFTFESRRTYAPEKNYDFYPGFPTAFPELTYSLIDASLDGGSYAQKKRRMIKAYTDHFTYKVAHGGLWEATRGIFDHFHKKLKLLSADDFELFIDAFKELLNQFVTQITVLREIAAGNSSCQKELSRRHESLAYYTREAYELLGKLARTWLIPRGIISDVKFDKSAREVQYRGFIASPHLVMKYPVGKLIETIVWGTGFQIIAGHDNGNPARFLLKLIEEWEEKQRAMPTTEATIATDTATWVEQQPAESAESFGPTVSDHVVARFVLSKTPAESANDEEAEIAASMAAADAEAEAQRGEDSDVADMDGHKGKGNHKGVKGDPYSHEFVKIMGEVFGIMKLAKDNRGKWSFGSAFDYDKAESILCDLSEKAREENDVVRERDIDSVFERLESRDRAVREGLEHYIRAYKRKWYAKRKNQRR